MLMLGLLAIAAVPGSISFGNSPVPAADFARQLTQLLFVPFLALPLWTLVTGISLARRRDTATETGLQVSSPVPAHSVA
jgi:hypothetical protein